MPNPIERKNMEDAVNASVSCTEEASNASSAKAAQHQPDSNLVFRRQPTFEHNETRSTKRRKNLFSRRPKLKTIDCRRTVTTSSLKISSPLSQSGLEFNAGTLNSSEGSSQLTKGKWNTSSVLTEPNAATQQRKRHATTQEPFCTVPNEASYKSPAVEWNNKDRNVFDRASGSMHCNNLDQPMNNCQITDLVYKRSPVKRGANHSLESIPQEISAYITHFLTAKELFCWSVTSKLCHKALAFGPVVINMYKLEVDEGLPISEGTPGKPGLQSTIVQHQSCLKHVENVCKVFKHAHGVCIVQNKVAHCSKVSKQITEALSHSLVSLNLSGSLFVDEGAFRRIVTHCGRLQNLNLKGCRRVDGASLVLKRPDAKYRALRSLKWLMVAGTSFSTIAINALQNLLKKIPSSPLSKHKNFVPRSLKGFYSNDACPSACEPFSSCNCPCLHICCSRTPALRFFMAKFLPGIVKGLKELVTNPLQMPQTADHLHASGVPANNALFAAAPQDPTNSTTGSASPPVPSSDSQPGPSESDVSSTLIRWQKAYCIERIQELVDQFYAELRAMDVRLQAQSHLVRAPPRAPAGRAAASQTNLEYLRIIVSILLTDGKGTLLDAPLNAFHASALMFASLTGRISAVQALMHHGADIEAATNAPAGPPSRASSISRLLDPVTAEPPADWAQNHLAEEGLVSDLSSDPGEDLVANDEQAHVWHATNNDREDGGATALYAASHRGHEDIVALLIRRGADVGAVRDSGVSSLYVAAQEGHLAVLRRLLQAGAYVECRRMDGTTPLFIAAQEGNLQVVEALLEHGADPNLANREGVTGLCSAARWGHLEVVRTLLQHGAAPACRDSSGATPLYCAAQEGHLAIVQELLKHGAMVDETGKDGATPLFVASSRGHRGIVGTLLRWGADPSHAMADGTTPAFIAAQMGHRAIIAMICDPALRTPQLRHVRVDINAARVDAVTPILIATAAGHIGCVELLLEMGGNPDVLTGDGTSPLYLAAQEGNRDLVRVLVQAGASTQLKDETGATPLHIASHTGHRGVVEELLWADADPLAETAGGFIPLQYALQAGHTEVSRMLLAKSNSAKLQLSILRGKGPKGENLAGQ